MSEPITLQAQAAVPSLQSQWDEWLKQNVKRRYRKAARAAINHLQPGATSADAEAVAHAAAREAELAYMARSALAAGALALAVSLLIGGLSLLFVVFALISGIRGRTSKTRGREALIGLGLAAASLVVFIAVHVA